MERGEAHVDRTEGRPGRSLPPVGLSFSICGMQCSPSAFRGLNEVRSPSRLAEGLAQSRGDCPSVKAPVVCPDRSKTNSVRFFPVVLGYCAASLGESLPSALRKAGPGPEPPRTHGARLSSRPLSESGSQSLS